MTPERWQRIKEVLGTALDLSPGDQAAYVAQVCGDDDAMRAEVESLIASLDAAGDLFDTPALEKGASTLDRAAAGLMRGARFGSFRVVEHIADGGMGAVYRGYDERDPERHPVAIKVVKPGLDHDDLLRRFRRERQILATLDHPNIARLLDAGAGDDGVPYFVMEFVEGQRIDRYCEARALTIEERLRLFLDVCAAVQYAHGHLILHRDIKPGNVLITSRGVPKLLDFGIGKILDPALSSRALDATVTALRMMTPEYASPEQARGDMPTAGTDIYSLGVMLHELLTGERPHRLSTRRLDGDLEEIVSKAMRDRPRRRYRSVADMAHDIERYLEGKPVRRRGRRRWWAIAAGASIVNVAVLAYALWSSFPSALQPAVRPPAGIVPFTAFQGSETQPYFSPDGSRMAFVWDGETGGKLDIYFKPLAGGKLERLTTDRAEDVSPAWSPDGQRIAFLRTSPKETAVFAAALSNGAHTKITAVYPNRIEAVGRHLDWSRDGRSLALADKNAPDEPFAIFLVDAATGRKRILTHPPLNSVGDSSPVFSPDSKSLAFLRAPSSGISDIYVVPLDGTTEPRRITFDDRLVASLTWTPDGKGIVFASDRTGENNLWRVSPDPRAAKHEPQRLPGIGESASEPAFSRDGSKLAYSQSFQDANIWRVDLNDGDLISGPARQWIASTLYDSSPQVSPDGRKIAFRSNRSGANEIWVCDDTGKDCAQLTRFNGPLTGCPHWSPDNRSIAFDSRPEGQADIYVISAEGGFPRRITNNSSQDAVPAWSLDGRWIYFSSNRTNTWQIWKIPAEGGAEIQVTRNGGFNAVESPDHRYLYYSRSRDAGGLWRMPLKGGAEQPVLEHPKPGLWGYWAVGRHGIYYLDRSAENNTATIFRFDLTTRRAQPVSVVDKPPALADAGFALSPDARYILYTQIDQSGSDIMLADYTP